MPAADYTPIVQSVIAGIAAIMPESVIGVCAG